MKYILHITAKHKSHERVSDSASKVPLDWLHSCINNSQVLEAMRNTFKEYFPFTSHRDICK